MREEGAEHVRLGGRKEADRRGVAAIILGCNEVDRMDVVELIDLVLVLDDRHVPAEQVDEKPLPVGKHGSEQRPVRRCQVIVDDVDHRAALTRGFAHEGSSRRPFEIDRAITRVDVAVRGDRLRRRGPH